MKMFSNSIQGGFIGNVAGNPFGSEFLIPQQSPGEADRLFRRGMDNTESGRKIKQNMERVRKMLPQATQGGMLPQQMNSMGNAAAGNMGGMLAQTNPMDPSYHAMPNSAEAVHARTFGVRNWNLGS
jgi:hypothetical protein